MFISKSKPQLSIFDLGIENPLGGGTLAKIESSALSLLHKQTNNSMEKNVCVVTKVFYISASSGAPIRADFRFEMLGAVDSQPL